MNFCQLSGWTGDLRHLPSTFYKTGRPSVIFRYFLCSLETSRQLLSTLLVTGTLSVNFRQLSSPKLSVNFLQLFVRPGELPTNFHAARKRSDNF